MKKLLGFIFVLLLGVSLVACSKKEAFNFEGDVLIVGLEADYPPFNWSETSANQYNHPIAGETNLFAAGYDVEIAKIIAAEMGMRLEIHMIEWSALVPSLKSNKIDLIIAGMSPTEDRMKEISFTNSYYDVNHVVVARANSSLNQMSELTSLKGLKGVGQKDTIYAELVEYVKNKYDAVELPVMDTVPMISTAIKSGGADFTIVEKPVALGMLGKNEGSDKDLAIVFETAENIFELSASDRTLSVGTRQIDTKLIETINLILKDITQQQRDALMDEAVSRSAE